MNRTSVLLVFILIFCTWISSCNTPIPNPTPIPEPSTCRTEKMNTSNQALVAPVSSAISPDTSILEMIDQTASIRNCSANLQLIRSQLPLFHLAIARTFFQGKTNFPHIAVSEFDYQGTKDVLLFDENLGNHTDWYDKVANLNLSGMSGEDYPKSIQNGLDILTKTGSKHQKLLLITDGSYTYTDTPEEFGGKLSTAFSNLSENQEVKVLLLCPDNISTDLTPWLGIDNMSGGKINVYSTSKPSWLQDLTNDLFAGYTDPLSAENFIHAGASKNMISPVIGVNKLHTIALSPGPLRLEPENQNFLEGDVPNSKYYPVSSYSLTNKQCSSDHQIVNSTPGDVFYWLENQTVDMSASIEIVSQTGQTPVIFETNLMLQVPNSNTVNILSCIEPSLIAKKGNLEIPVSIAPGASLWEPNFANNEFSTQWLWNSNDPPESLSFSVVDKVGNMVYEQDLVPSPFIYSVDISEGTGRDEYWTIKMPIWFPEDLPYDGQLKNSHVKANSLLIDWPKGIIPSCPDKEKDGYYSIPNLPGLIGPSNDDGLPQQQQIIYRWQAGNVINICNLEVDIFKTTAWEIDKGQETCGYDTIYVDWQNASWQCEFPTRECHLIP